MCRDWLRNTVLDYWKETVSYIDNLQHRQFEFYCQDLVLVKAKFPRLAFRKIRKKQLSKIIIYCYIFVSTMCVIFVSQQQERKTRSALSDSLICIFFINIGDD